MKVILRTRIESLGRPGDIVEVKVGFARNYLLPRNLAYYVTPDNLQRIHVEKERFDEEERQRLDSLRSLAERIRGVSCSIEAKASEDGKLYGSVTAVMIAEALAAEGITIEPKQIHLDKPIKETGVISVPVHLHADIETAVKVWVMDSSEEAKAASDAGEAAKGDAAQ